MGQAVGALIGLIIFGYFLYPQSKPDINEDLNNRKVLLEKLKEYGLPFVVLAVVNWILNLGNRYILGAYNGLVDVGLFTVAFSIASRPFIMISSVMSSFFRPILFQAESNRDSSKASTIFSYWMAGISIIGSLGVTGFLFFGDTIAKLLLAEEYRVQAPSLFKWICIGYALYGIIQTIENRILSFGKSRRIILPSIIGAIINIFAGIILIPILGIIGAAQSVFFSFFIQMLVITFILFKQKNEKGTTLNK